MRGPVASNQWHPGLYLAFWQGATFLGEFRAGDPGAIARELAPFGTTDVLVFDDAELSSQLKASHQFKLMASVCSTSAGHSAHVFRIGGDARPDPDRP